MEDYYEAIKDHIKGKNNAQEIAEILALEYGNKEEKIQKVIELYDLLKASKKKIRKDSSCAILASLAILKEDSKSIVSAILEVDNYIGSQKGKGLWTLGRETRLMISMMIVESLYCQSDRKLKGISLINSIILQEILTYIICMNMLLID